MGRRHAHTWKGKIMKKNEMKKGLKLQLNRETLHMLEHPDLERIAGGISLAASCQNCSANSQLTCCSRLC
jgi:hypothetical protein